MEVERTVDIESYINDHDNDNDYKTNTFSKFNKNEVKKTFLSELLKGRIENACHWCAELICSYHLNDIWEIFLFYLGKHIYLGNPKIIIYLENRWNYYETLLENKVIKIRNNSKLRQLFAEIICFLIQSKKRQCNEPCKLSINDDFNVTYISTRLKACSTNYSDNIFQSKDPTVFFIAINEFCYSISKNINDIMSSCYWIEWIIDFDCICRKKKKKNDYICVKRMYIPVEAKYQMDVIWIIWDALFFYTKEYEPIINTILQSLFNLFCINYTTAMCKKRHYLLFLAAGLLIDNVDSTIELIHDRNIVINVINQIDDVYKEIKKNQIVN